MADITKDNRWADITVERDPKDNRVFFFTPQTERGNDWIIGYATNLSYFLGKSLIVKKWDVPNALELLDEANVTYTEA
jgi:hypothetical protein